MIHERLARVRACMLRHGLEQLIVIQPQEIYYLTGLWCNPMDRLDALIITHDACRMLCYNLALSSRRTALSPSTGIRAAPSRN